MWPIEVNWKTFWTGVALIAVWHAWSKVAPVVAAFFPG